MEGVLRIACGVEYLGTRNRHRFAMTRKGRGTGWDMESIYAWESGNIGYIVDNQSLK
jgi:hypothetical protein